MVLADRVACLLGPIVAGRLVAHPNSVRSPPITGSGRIGAIRPTRRSKAVVENLVCYAKTDLVIPSCDGWMSLSQANDAAREWCVGGEQ